MMMYVIAVLIIGLGLYQFYLYRKDRPFIDKQDMAKEYTELPKVLRQDESDIWKKK